MQDQHITNSATESEIWADVVGYESLYSVSSHGRVRRDAPAANSYVGRILIPKPKKNGYHNVSLSCNGVVAQQPIHTLVLAAFVGPRPDGLVTNHIDGCKANNHLSNLEYVTYSENAVHKFRMGLGQTGDNHWTRRHPERVPRGVSRHSHGPKLAEQDVRDIRAALANGETGASIAMRYRVGPTVISRINTRHTWRHID